MNITAPSPLSCALWLAGQGMAVFAVDSPALPECAGAHGPGRECNGQRGKHPCGRWSRDATTDTDVTHRMFGSAPRNIGVACGPSGLLVVDEDEPGALVAYADSIRAVVPVTFSVLTSRGAHRYFHQPAGVPLGNSPGPLAAFHVDIRGAGGFVVGPGSVHASGHVYRPINSHTPIVDAPSWLVEALRPALVATSTNARTRERLSSSRQPASVLDGLAAFVSGSAAGQRNGRLFWAACRAFEHCNAGRLVAAEVETALLDAASAVGLAESEARATIGSAQRTIGSRLPR